MKDFETINWTYTRDAAKPEVGFIVKRKEVGDTDFVEVGRVDAGVFKFEDKHMVDGCHYEWKVVAHFADGTKAPVVMGANS